jgi:hypothetical protein
LIKERLKIYPYTPGGYGTSIATALEGKVRLEVNPPIPPTKFVEASGKSFNTIPPNDFSYFEMINELVQMEPATSTSPELLGQLAAIGIVKGKPFNPDARMKKTLTEAAAVGNAARAPSSLWIPRSAALTRRSLSFRRNSITRSGNCRRRRCVRPPMATSPPLH